jgi:hypothetical protein
MKALHVSLSLNLACGQGKSVRKFASEEQVASQKRQGGMLVHDPPPGHRRATPPQQGSPSICPWRKEKTRDPAEKMNAINRNATSTYPLAVYDASLERLRAPRRRITHARQHSLGVEAALDEVEAVAQQAPVELAVDGLVVEVEHLGLQNRMRQGKGTAPSTTEKRSRERVLS